MTVKETPLGFKEPLLDCPKWGADRPCHCPLSPRSQMPKVTHYTLFEGGPWHEWQKGCMDAGDIFAIKLENGWIWDSLVGWRQS